MIELKIVAPITDTFINRVGSLIHIKITYYNKKTKHFIESRIFEYDTIEYNVFQYLLTTSDVEKVAFINNIECSYIAYALIKLINGPRIYIDMKNLIKKPNVTEIGILDYNNFVKTDNKLMEKRMKRATHKSQYNSIW